MPREKDLKRLVRRQMGATGERYTQARERLRGRGLPAGWRLDSDRLDAYGAGLETDAGRQLVVLRSTATVGRGTGSLSRHHPAAPHRGQRVRVTASVSGEDVRMQAGLWLGAQDANGDLVAFDMDDRPLTGSFGWRPAEVAVDVVDDAVEIRAGVSLHGTGTVRLADMELAAVAAGAAVPPAPGSDGWSVWSSRPGAYRLSVERATDGPVATLRAGDGAAGEASMSQTVLAGELRALRGRRARLEARLRSEDGEATVRLGMTVLDARNRILTSDNMEDRALLGAFGWTPASIVVDVPEAAAAVGYGISVSGAGPIHVAGVRLEPVGADLPVTSFGWTLSAPPGTYEVLEEPGERGGGGQQLVVRAATADSPGAVLLRWETIGDYRGRVVRLRAWLRGEDVEPGAGLVLSAIDAEPSEELGEEPQTPLHGTFGWQEVSVTAPIPGDAEGVVYGVVMAGRGVVHIAEPRLDTEAR